LVVTFAIAVAARRISTKRPVHHAAHGKVIFAEPSDQRQRLEK
jgi:hypothetical protein